MTGYPAVHLYIKDWDSDPFPPARSVETFVSCHGFPQKCGNPADENWGTSLLVNPDSIRSRHEAHRSCI